MTQDDTAEATFGVAVIPWLRDTRAALRGEIDADVPCGTCTACCASSQFVHIAVDETDALAHIPDELLFPAPGASGGDVLMGYDDAGRCPMLDGAGCSIYAHRPRTCRTFDCRVFPATGVSPDAAKPLIAEQAVRWRLQAETDDSRAALAALRAAADFVRRHRNHDLFGAAKHTETGLAVIAIQISDAFVDARDSTDRNDEEMLEQLEMGRAGLGDD